jgi:hypothetical protein
MSRDVSLRDLVMANRKRHNLPERIEICQGVSGRVGWKFWKELWMKATCLDTGKLV